MSVADLYRRGGAALAGNDHHQLDAAVAALAADSELAVAAAAYIVGLFAADHPTGHIVDVCRTALPDTDPQPVDDVLTAIRADTDPADTDLVTAALILTAAAGVAGAPLPPFDVTRDSAGRIIWITPPTT